MTANDTQSVSVATASQLNQMLSLFKLLDALIEEARQRSQAEHSRNHLSVQQFLNWKFDKEMGRRYNRARGGETRLPFDQLLAILMKLEKWLPDHDLSDARKSAELYAEFTQNLTAKRIPNWSAIKSTKDNLAERFEQLLIQYDLQSKELLTEPDRFVRFLDGCLGKPAHLGQQGVAVTDARAIIAHLKEHHEKTAPQLSENDYLLYRGLTAWMGAFAAQSTGQWSQFREFMTTIVEAKATNSQTSIICYATMVRHYNTWGRFFGWASLPGDVFDALTAVKEAEPDAFSSWFKNSPLLKLGPLTELVKQGLSADTVTGVFGHRSILEAADIETLGSFGGTDQERLHNQASLRLVRSRAQLNSNAIEGAQVELVAAEECIRELDPGFRETGIRLDAALVDVLIQREQQPQVLRTEPLRELRNRCFQQGMWERARRADLVLSGQ